MRAHNLVFAAGALLAASAWGASIASAAVIASNTGGAVTSIMPGFFGQSFTTAAGGSANNLTFSFYSDVPPTTPEAVGTAFLLSQEYLGTPSGLSSSASGFLGQTTASGNVYTFNSALTLQPSTLYWLYENGSIPSLSGDDTYSGGQIYFTNSAGTAFAAGGVSANFTLDGTVTPEPSSLTLLGLTGLALGLPYFCWKRRHHPVVSSGDARRTVRPPSV